MDLQYSLPTIHMQAEIFGKFHKPDSNKDGKFVLEKITN